jgi:hypothetical protein
MSQQPPPQERPWQPQMNPLPPYQPQMPPPQMAPQKPKSRKRLWLIIGVAVLVLIVISAIASQAGNSNQPTTTTQATQPANTGQQPTTQVPTQGPQPTPTPTTKTYPHFDDGTFVVGKDIQPGTYRTREASPGCYYARLSGFGGTFDEIIANNNTDAPAIVTIAASDKGFESTRCGTWTKV